MKYIYTVITDNKDTLNENVNAEGAKLVCFTNTDMTSDKWEIRKIPNLFTDPRRNSRLPKLLPHIYLPEAEYSLYLDGNIGCKVPVQTLIDEWLKDTDIACFAHTSRDCYFDEAKECIRLGLDDSETIINQCLRYKDVPRNKGLYQGGVILRKHTPEVARFNEKWWAEYCTGSKRDQISFPVALGDLPINAIKGHAYFHPYFEMQNHKVLSEWAGKV